MPNHQVLTTKVRVRVRVTLTLTPLIPYDRVPFFYIHPVENFGVEFGTNFGTNPTEYEKNVP